jgi:hypothetical protein
MEKITQSEKILLLSGLDLTVTTLSNQLNNTPEEETRGLIRSKISECILLSNKIVKIIPSDSPKTKNDV